MSAATITRVRAVLHLVQKIKILVLLAAAKVIYNGMFAQAARFPSPVPALVDLLAQITGLETAQHLVASGVHGVATAARNTARDLLWSSLLSLKAYVQTIADATESDAVEIIKSAGFDVAVVPPPRDKPVLAATLTIVSGQVKLAANARALVGSYRKRAIYNWEYSIDGGHTWLSAQSTTTATTVISGLPATTTCSFRVCVTVGNVMQPWSQVVTLLVH